MSEKIVIDMDKLEAAIEDADFDYREAKDRLEKLQELKDWAELDNQDVIKRHSLAESFRKD